MKYRIYTYDLPSTYDINTASKAINDELEGLGRGVFVQHGEGVEKFVVDGKVGIHLREGKGLHLRIIRTTFFEPWYVKDILYMLGIKDKIEPRSFHSIKDNKSATLDVLIRGG